MTDREMRMDDSKGKPDLLNALGMAFGFLTVFPVTQRKEWSDRDFGWSVIFYPAAGALIGAVSGYALMILAGIAARPLAAFLSLIIWILLSGGLHWDGLADCMDGFGCSAGPERRLEIMKDPRLGTYGALGIFCALILKWLCLWYLPVKNVPLFLALSGASARWVMLLLNRFPLANPNGMAAMLRKNAPARCFLYAAPLPVILACLLGISGICCLAVNLCAAAFLGWTAQKKIGGVNGDVLGFSIESGEIIILLLAQVLPL